MPEAVDEILMRCLEPDPAARYQSAALLLADHVRGNTLFLRGTGEKE